MPSPHEPTLNDDSEPEMVKGYVVRQLKKTPSSDSDTIFIGKGILSETSESQRMSSSSSESPEPVAHRQKPVPVPRAQVVHQDALPSRSSDFRKIGIAVKAQEEFKKITTSHSVPEKKPLPRGHEKQVTPESPVRIQEDSNLFKKVGSGTPTKTPGGNGTPEGSELKKSDISPVRESGSTFRKVNVPSGTPTSATDDSEMKKSDVSPVRESRKPSENTYADKTNGSTISKDEVVVPVVTAPLYSSPNPPTQRVKPSVPARKKSQPVAIPPPSSPPPSYEGGNHKQQSSVTSATSSEVSTATIETDITTTTPSGGSLDLSSTAVQSDESQEQTLEQRQHHHGIGRRNATRVSRNKRPPLRPRATPRDDDTDGTRVADDEFEISTPRDRSRSGVMRRPGRRPQRGAGVSSDQTASPHTLPAAKDQSIPDHPLEEGQGSDAPYSRSRRSTASPQDKALALARRVRATKSDLEEGQNPTPKFKTDGEH